MGSCACLVDINFTVHFCFFLFSPLVSRIHNCNLIFFSLVRYSLCCLLPRQIISFNYKLNEKCSWRMQTHFSHFDFERLTCDCMNCKCNFYDCGTHHACEGDYGATSTRSFSCGLRVRWTEQMNHIGFFYANKIYLQCCNVIGQVFCQLPSRYLPPVL